MSRPSTASSSRSKILIGLFVLILLGLMIAAAVWISTRSTVGTRLAAIRAQNLPATAAQINDFYMLPPSVENSTALWIVAADRVDLSPAIRNAKDLPIFGSGKTPPPPGTDWNQLDACRELLASLKPELTAARMAAQAGGSARFPVDFSAGIATLLPQTQNLRGVARLFMLDAYVSAHDGDHARVLDDIHGMLATSDALHFEPCIISQLVRVASRAMAIQTLEKLMPYCEWSDAELAAIQQRLMSVDLKASFQRGFIGERAMTLSAMENVPLGPFRASNELAAMDFYEESIESLNGSWTDALLIQQDQTERMRELSTGSINRLKYSGVLLLLPAAGQAVQAGARTDSVRRSACIGIAMQRHKLANGTLPKSIADIAPTMFQLPPGLPLTEVLTDPFDNQPLRLKIQDNQITIYSVGMDLKDDGGELGDEDGGRATDFGFRIPR